MWPAVGRTTGHGGRNLLRDLGFLLVYLKGYPSFLCPEFGVWFVKNKFNTTSFT
jgi:hypothetical protein